MVITGCAQHTWGNRFICIKSVDAVDSHTLLSLSNAASVNPFISSSHHQLSNRGCSIRQIDDFPSTIDGEPTNVNHCAKKTSRYMHKIIHETRLDRQLAGFWDSTSGDVTLGLFIALKLSPPGGHMGLVVPVFPALQSVDIGIHPRFTTGHRAGHGARRGSGCRRNEIAKSDPKHTNTEDHRSEADQPGGGLMVSGSGVRYLISAA